MNPSCWKYGLPTSEGVVECEKCSNVTFTYSHTMQTRKIDWNKVNTVDDMKKIWTVFSMQVVAGSPAEETLREFLED